MTRHRAPALALGLLAALASGASAQHRPRTVEGSEVQRRTEEMAEAIDWKRSLEDVLGGAEASDRVAVWVQIVGELDDGL